MGFWGVNMHNVLLLWDAGEGEELYRIQVTDDEFKDLCKINDMYANSNLPEDLEPQWNYVESALCSNSDDVEEKYKDVAGKWDKSRWKVDGKSILMSGQWTLICTGTIQ